MTKTCVIASRNQGKLQEFAAILAPYDIPLIPMDEAGFTGEIPETGTTFQENAALKAETVAEALGWKYPVISDDSGLIVDALGGKPGVYSHRFAGENADDVTRYEKVLSLLGNTPRENRTARFTCVICLCDTAHHLHFFSGNVEGNIAFTPRGQNGFGYDPIFCPEGGARTMAEIPTDQKNTRSHRARALDAFCTYLAEGGFLC